jgi:hypothetical protein
MDFTPLTSNNRLRHLSIKASNRSSISEIAPELTGHGLPLGKCEAYNRVYDQYGGFLYSLGFHLLLGRVYDNKDVQERIVRRSKLRPASIGLPKNGDDGRVGEARRITFAVINVTDNVRGDLSAHVITVFELNRQKIARAIECDGHDAESVGIIDTTDVV